MLRLGGGWADCRLFQLVHPAWRLPRADRASPSQNPGMDVAVLGASGEIGARLADGYDRSGNTVRRLSRSTGVDVLTGEGLTDALAGADLVVDATNRATVRAREAIAFFGRASARIATAAQETGVARIVCISIAGCEDPAVQRGYGYYRGKAAQAATYRASPLPVTVVASAQWFELADQIGSALRLGPLAVVPRMTIAPLAAARAGALVVEHTAGASRAEPRGSGDRELRLRGPETMTAAELVRRVRAARAEQGIGVGLPRAVLELPLLGAAIARGALVPEDALVDEQRLEEWARSA